MRIGLTLMKQNMKQRTLNSFFSPRAPATAPAVRQSPQPSKVTPSVEQVSSPAKRLCMDKENS